MPPRELIDRLADRINDCEYCGLPLLIRGTHNGYGGTDTARLIETLPTALRTKLEELGLTTALQTGFRFDIANNILTHTVQGLTCNVIAAENEAKRLEMEPLPDHLDAGWRLVETLLRKIGFGEKASIRVALLSRERGGPTHRVWVPSRYKRLADLHWARRHEIAFDTAVAADILNMTPEEIDAKITLNYFLAD